MTREASVRARLTNQSHPGTAAGAASASRNGGVAPRGRPPLLPRPRRQTRGAMCPIRSSPWSRLTMTTTQPIPMACWTPTPTRRAKGETMAPKRTSPPTSRGSLDPCCSPGSTSSPCACLAVIKVLLLSRPELRVLECGSFTPTVTSGK